MRRRLTLVIVISSIVASGCGGSVSSNQWTVVGMTPDERHLLISTLFGGVASGCTRWEGWEVDESEKQVEVSALIWRKRFPSGCTAEGVTETIAVDLDEALGSRDLSGCGEADCRTLKPELGLGLWELDVVTSHEGVVVANVGNLWSFGSDGAALWNRATGTTALSQASFDSVVAYDGRTTTVYDPSSGAEIWRANGSIASTGEQIVYMCQGGPDSLAAVDSETGVELWQVDLPCDLMAVHDGVITIVAADREVDGGNELVLVDTATGDVIHHEKFDDGVDDRVAGFEGVTVVGELVVVAGQQADFVVLGPGADEVMRLVGVRGSPIGAADGLVILATHDRVSAMDPTTGEAVWESTELTLDSIVVSNGTLWSLDWPTGSFSRIDPHSGDPVWTTSVGLTSGFDVAADISTAYVGTSLAVIALDSTSGELLWWRHLPFRSQ